MTAPATDGGKAAVMLSADPAPQPMIGFSLNHPQFFDQAASRPETFSETPPTFVTSPLKKRSRNGEYRNTAESASETTTATTNAVRRIVRKFRVDAMYASVTTRNC